MAIKGQWGIVRALALLVCLPLFGCLTGDVEVCASGRVCPAGTACDDERDRCVSDDQRVACDGLQDADACSFGGVTGRCLAGFCEAFVCGDGIVTAPEDCEPGILGGATCITRGFHFQGGLACNPETCRYDDSACLGQCGDGVRNGPEACDGPDLDGKDCTDFAFYSPGGLACNPASCTFDTSGCMQECGDNTVNGEEDCDGSPPTRLTCLDMGFDTGHLDCTNVCTPATGACLRYGWSPVDIGTSDSLRSVWASRDDDVYILGEAATYHFDGAAWTAMPAGPKACGERSEIWGRSASEVYAATCAGLFSYDGSSWSHIVSDEVLLGIGAAGPADVFAVGEQGVVLRFDGSSWTSIPYSGAETLIDVSGTSATDLWVIEWSVLRHYDGTGWTRVEPGVANGGGFYSAIETIDDELFVAAPGTFLPSLLLHFDGSTWTGAELGHMNAVAATSTGRVLAAGLTGALSHYDGHSWNVGRSGGGLELYDVFASPGGSSYAVGEGGAVLRFDGLFSVARTTLPWRIEGLWAVPGTDELYGAGCELLGGTGWPAVFHFDGEAWALVHRELSVMGCNAGIWGSGPNDIYVVGETASSGYRWDGNQWAAVDGFNAEAIWGFSATDIFAVGYHSSRYNGASWQSMDPGSVELSAVWGSAPDNVFAAGSSGEIRHFDGATWSPMTAPTAANVQFVWGTGASDVYAGTAGGELLRYDGSNWTVMLEIPGSTIHTAAGTGPDDLFIGVDNGAVLHFDGDAWEPMRSDTTSSIRALHATSRRIIGVGDFGALTELHRDQFWHCPATERLCGDGIDNDCDNLVDEADSDCP